MMIRNLDVKVGQSTYDFLPNVVIAHQQNPPCFVLNLVFVKDEYLTLAFQWPFAERDSTLKTDPDEWELAYYRAFFKAVDIQENINAFKGRR